MDYNSTTQVGRLAADPVLTPGEKAPDENGIRPDDRVWGRLAVNRPKIAGKETGTDYFPFCAWGKLAHVFMTYCMKGKEVLLEGALRTNPKMRPDGSWDNYTEIVVHKVVLGNAPGLNKNTAQQMYQPQPAYQPQPVLSATEMQQVVSAVVAAVNKHLNASPMPTTASLPQQANDNPFVG